MDKQEMIEQLTDMIYEIGSDYYCDEPIHQDDDMPDFIDSRWDECKELLIKFIKEELWRLKTY